MRMHLTVFAVLLCCVVSLSDQAIALLASQRAWLVFALLFWIRCEVYVYGSGGVGKAEGRMVKENYELSQTVMNLSEQHRLLCEIRNAALKTVKYSRDVLAELKFPSHAKCSFSSSTMSSTNGSTPSPESKPDILAEQLQPASPLLRAKAIFLRGSVSESGISVLRDTKCQ